MARILMVGAEAAPFASTGGLADVLRALPEALVQAGEDVAVVLPFYRNADVPDPRVVYERLPVSFGPHSYLADILENVENGVPYLFARIPELFDREGLYDVNQAEYPDNHIRFGALCRASLGVAKYIFRPDLLHCHDWEAGLTPVLLREIYRNHPAYLGLKTVFTIHNLAYQGLFSQSALADLGLPASSFRSELLAFHGQVNCMKGALVSSDLITTVSPQYAQEIQTPAYGLGLDEILRSRNNDLRGILNGANYKLWDPATDGQIAQQYEASDLSGKQACKRALLAELGFAEERLARPVIAIIARFVSQKGLDLLMPIPHELAREDVSLVVMGNGDSYIEDFFHWFATAYPDRVALRIGYDDAFAHRIQAGSDMLLMPSRYEPCGLNQLYSLRYGTLPLVRATGGLEDTVDADTGFKFWGENPHDLLECVRAALRVFGTPRWGEMMKSAMQRDFSWRASAQRYIRSYRELMA